MNRASIWVALALAALCQLHAASAADTVQTGIQGGTATDSWKHTRCSPGTYLIGIGETLTDRMVGYWQLCTGAAQGHWAGDVIAAWGPGNVRSPAARWKRCPPDYYMVGLQATRGYYGPGVHELIADLQPVCRTITQPTKRYETHRGYFEGADDNKLVDLNWGGQNSPKACQNGTVAVGIAFNYKGSRDQDPENQFLDAALICSAVTGVPLEDVSKVRPKP